MSLQDGSERPEPARKVKPQGRLLLTMCTPALKQSGEYARTLVRYPESYQEAENVAKGIFSQYIQTPDTADRQRGYGRQAPRRDIVLKCAITRANGVAFWCDFRKEDWRDIIRPSEDEIGVFVNGYTDLPYDPSIATRSTQTGPEKPVSKKPSQQATASTSTSSTSEIKMITLISGNEKKNVFAPPSLNALRKEVQQLFDGFYHPDLSDILIKYVSASTEVYLQEGAYSQFIKSQPSPVVLHAESSSVNSRSSYYDYD